MTFASLRRSTPSRTAATVRAWRRLGAALALAGLPLACTGDDTSGTPGNGVPSPDAGNLDAGATPDTSLSNDAAPLEDDASLDISMPQAEASAPEAGAPDARAPDAPTGDGSTASPCSSLPGHLVYIESGDTQENLLKNLGRHLRDSANITLAFSLTGSCTLTNDAYTGARIAANATLLYIPSTAENPNWTPSMPEATCSTGAGGAPIDVAISALFVQSCGLGVPEAGTGLALIQGPIQAYTFIVPTQSDQNAIWAEEGYYAFGFGVNNPLAPTYNPWNNEQFMFIRPATKSTLVATAKNIAVPPAKWKGMPLNASSDVVNAVKNTSMVEPTIGILGAEVYDANRGGNIKTLAFQAFGQDGAYYPDSTSTAFDKRNLRDGHYTLWSPTVYITKVDGNNVPTDPAVKYMLDLVLGNPGATPPEGGTPIDGLADVVKVGLIPQCAMQVTRSEDGGDLSPYSPAEPCTCYYLSKIVGAAGTPPGCTTCTTDDECGDGGAGCVHGFCEPSGAEARSPGDGGNACFAGIPSTHAEIINACTDAQVIDKVVVLPNDGGLTPLP